MASNISAGGSEQYVEERVLAGLVTGSLLQHKELLDMLADVDVFYPRQRTLLHAGVGLGKADWVEELLARGADTGITDDSQQNALSSAEEMVRQFPEDVDRSEVLRLVTLVHRRDQVMIHRLESSSSSKSTDHKTSVDRSNQDIASLKSSVDSLRREMKSLVRQLSSSFKELKSQVCGRDALLRCLEEAVTSTAEDVTSMKCGPGGGAALSTATSDPARAKQECVDAMMRRTRIVYGSGVDEMRRFYERLYDEDDLTACVIKYLNGDDRVKVMVDLESEYIGRMRKKAVFLDGTRKNGSELCSFCDFESETVYSGALVNSGNSEGYICAELACALSQLSLKLVFGNEGRPYGKGDAGQEREWMRALDEVKEERRKRCEGIHVCINYALNSRSQLGRVCYLASAVPEIIAYNRSTEGRSLLQQQAPSSSLYILTM